MKIYGKKILNFIMVFCLLLPCIFLSACDFWNNNSNNNANNGQNEIADASSIYNSIVSSTASVTNKLTSEQKNTTWPSSVEKDATNTNVYSITADGNYYYNGSSTTAITVAQSVENVHVYFESATFNTTKASVISCADESNTNIIITLKGANSFTNTGKAKHIINVSGNLVINGSGTLTITSTKSAIACDKTFIGLGGTLDITAANHGITANSIYIDGMTINATECGKDILHAEIDDAEVEASPVFDFDAGFVYVISGTINTTSVWGDGIQADTFVYIKGGTFNLTTTPDWENYVATENEEKGMFSTSTHQKVGRDSVHAGSTYAVLKESVKGIKVGEIDYYLATDEDEENELTVSSYNYTILIEGGTFDITTVDDAIHTNSGSVFIYGGDITINTSDDGIHADTNLKIAGNAVVDIQNSYEGIEAQTIDITGGTTTILALDDGVNASNGNLTESQQKSVCQINISGGRLDVTVNPNGDRDGIDSNGGIKITGGVVITRGPNNQNACPLDAANAISVTGGTLIVIGNPPMTNGRFSGPGGPGTPSETSFTTSLTKTQVTSKGLSSGNHTVVVNGTTISYTNAYSYSGYTTVYASKTATIN